MLDSPARRAHLRPLALGDLLDLSVALYREKFARYFAMVLLVNAPVFALQVLLQRLAPEFELQASGRSPTLPEVVRQLEYLGLALGAWCVNFVLNQIGLGAVTAAVSSDYLGKPLGVFASYSRVARRLPALLGVGALATSATLSGMACFCLPGLFAMAVFVLSSQIVVLEGLGPIAALRRSFELVVTKSERGLRRHNLSRLSVLLAVWTAILVASLAVSNFPILVAGAVYEFQGKDLELELAPMVRDLLLVLSGLIGVTAQPLLMISLVLFYYDLRSRHEGFDLEHMAREMGESSGRPLQAGAP